MNVLENKSKYGIEEMLAIAERDGNKKRPYLLLNKLQAKYLPVNPEITLDMFDELFAQIQTDLKGKKVLVIGFAETATAIGARIAEDIQDDYHADVTFLPTTREVYQQKPMVEFEEVHSHAVEQILYGDQSMFEEADYIVFVEDEVTTGNTILNCVKTLNLPCEYLVVSIMNCMSETELHTFKEYHITPYWLIKTDKTGFERVGENEHTDTPYNPFPFGLPYVIKNKISNPRLGVKIEAYKKECQAIADRIDDIKENTLILGTEECMYPAIITAKELKKRTGKNVVVSATTRVPACTNQNEDYPLHDRKKIKSCYGNRDTYVYNLKKYEEVIIVTDGKWNFDLLSVLFSVGNIHVKIIHI